MKRSSKANYTFRGRSEKMELVSRLFQDYVDGKVLDLGSDQSFLRESVKDYIGLDISGNPDVIANLENGIPIKDKSFDCVLCFDVLEHLEKFHDGFDEACRVSKKYVVIGLPNLYCIDFRLKFLLGRPLGGKYGLPLEQPVDRHRWIYTLGEAVKFIRNRGEKNNFTVVWESYVYYRYRRLVPRLVSYFGRRALPNLFAWSYWAVLERVGG